MGCQCFSLTQISDFFTTLPLNVPQESQQIDLTDWKGEVVFKALKPNNNNLNVGSELSGQAACWTAGTWRRRVSYGQLRHRMRQIVKVQWHALVRSRNAVCWDINGTKTGICRHGMRQRLVHCTSTPHCTVLYRLHEYWTKPDCSDTEYVNENNVRPVYFIGFEFHYFVHKLVSGFLVVWFQMSRCQCTILVTSTSDICTLHFVFGLLCKNHKINSTQKLRALQYSNTMLAINQSILMHIHC